MKLFQQGFSLIELLLVLALIGIVLALASPRLNSTLDSLQFKRLSKDVVSSLRVTRAQAISKGQDGIWLINLDQHYFQYGQKNNRVSYADDIDVTLTTASKEQLTDTVGRIRFFPDGSATGGEILLVQDPFEFVIQIDWLTGQIKIDD